MDMRSLFEDVYFKFLVKNRFPIFLQEINVKHRQNGKIAQEVGKAREAMINGALRHMEDVRKASFLDISKISVTEKDIDAFLFDRPVSIKTISPSSGGTWGNVKLHWTSGVANGDSFKNNYRPNYDLMILRIVWEGQVKKPTKQYAGLHYIPKEVQQEAFDKFGSDGYLGRVDNEGDNKGTCIKFQPGWMMFEDPRTLHLNIDWPTDDKSESKGNYAINYWKERFED